MYAPRKSVSGTYTSQGMIENVPLKEYEYHKTHNGLVLFVGLLLVILIALFIRYASAHAMGDNVTNYEAYGLMTGGDCQAKSATGDTYQSINDASCQTSLAFGIIPHYMVSEKMTIEESPVVVIVKPHKKHHKHEASGNNTSVNSQDTGNNSQVSDDPSDSKPHEKGCKNKNSGRDGTPNECNAGGGQEKHSSSIALGLYILLMKAYSKNDEYMPLMRKDRLATFDNLFSMRRYLRRYDKSLLHIIKV